MPDYAQMGVNDLLRNADDAIGSPDSVHSLQVAEIKMQQAQAELASHALVLNGKLLDGNEAARTIAKMQVDLSAKANDFSERLLLSNEQACKQNEENAKLMNSATEQLAKSTASLKWATWVLVAFTAVQALIAFIALFKK